MKRTVDLSHVAHTKVRWLEEKGFELVGCALTGPDNTHAWVNKYGLVLWPQTQDQANEELQRRATDLTLIDELKGEIAVLKEEIRYLDQLMKAK